MQTNNDDTYEDEDPLTPDIDMILADKQVEEPITSGGPTNNIS